MGPALALWLLQNTGTPDVQAQLDGNGDGYGDEWFSPYANYAQDLIDKLQDPENNLQGDGLPNLHEFRWQTVPIGPFPGNLFRNAMDFDGDHWNDGPEVDYWNDSSNDPKVDTNPPPNPADVKAPPLAILDPDYGQNFDGDEWTTTHDRDSDNDGLLDGDEFNLWGSYPEFKDSDCYMPDSCPSPAQVGTTWAARSHEDKPGTGDNMTDAEELAHWNGLGDDAWGVDYDGDGIVSNLLDPDSDGDGVLDSDEFRCKTINAASPGAPACTHPGMYDTDLDGLSDGAGEATATTDPLNPDTDGDGMPDGWEYRYHLDPRTSDGWSDADQDHLSNVGEYSYHCNVDPCPVTPVYESGLEPTNPDKENDALLDGEEVWAGADPFRTDTDYDGLLDGEEYHGHGTSPADPDSDDDKLTDYQEAVTYRVQRPNPSDPNTDGCCRTQNDILSDYDEIIVYHTNVTNWDTDNDNSPDGVDERPNSFDKEPVAVRLSQNTPFAVDEAYVIFREEGYMDIVVRDPHDDEREIELVTVQAQLAGQLVNGESATASVVLDATRADDGMTWGTRMPVPSKMQSVSSESFTLVVVTSTGNAVSYSKSVAVPMRNVRWTEQQDPADANGWYGLADHLSQGTADAGAASMNLNLPQPGSVTTDPRAIAETLANATQDAPGTAERFAVFRLKPTVIQPAPESILNATATLDPSALTLDVLGLGNVPGAASWGILQTVVWDTLPDGTRQPYDLSALNISLVQDAFEAVDPLLEPGVYATFSETSSNTVYWSSPRDVWEGSTPLMFRQTGGYDTCTFYTVPEFCASFFFGSTDPRAKSNVAGSLVAGIIGYRTLQEYKTAIQEGDDKKSAEKAAELALMITPFGLAMMGKFSVASTRVAATDRALAGRMLADQSDAMRAGDLSAETLGNHVRLAEFGAANPTLTTDMRMIRLASSGSEFRSLALGPAPASEMAHSIRLAVAGSEAETVRVLSGIRSGQLGAETGYQALDINGKLNAAMKSEALRRGKTADQTAGETWIAFDSMSGRGVTGVDKLYNTLRGKMSAQPVMGYGHMGEAIQGGRLARGEYSLVMDNGQVVQLQLREVALDEITVVVDGVTYKAKMDAAVMLPDGRLIFTEIKYGVTTAEGKAALYDQMDREGAVAWQRATEQADKYAKELHWRFEGTPDQNMIDAAKWTSAKYEGLKIRFFNERGAQVFST